MTAMIVRKLVFKKGEMKMNNRKFSSNHRNFMTQLAAIVILAVVASFAAQAAGVRPFPVSSNFNGQFDGGFMMVTVQNPPNPPTQVPVYFGSQFADSTPDGRFTIFTTNVPVYRFIPGEIDSDNAQDIDVIIRDTLTGEMRCLSCLTNEQGSQPRLSADGRFAVFAAGSQVYRYEWQTDALVVVSRNAQNSGDGNNYSYSPLISRDGRYIVFESVATNLVASYINEQNRTQIFIRDMQTQTTRLVSHRRSQAEAGGNSFASNASMTDNGRFIVWTSSANDYSFTPADSNNAEDVFIFDRDAPDSSNNIRAVSIVPNGTTTGNAASINGVVAAEYTNVPSVVFSSRATNISPADTNSLNDIYLRDGDGFMKLASGTHNGQKPDGDCIEFPVISRTGRFVAFTSKATNLVAGISDTGTAKDVFVYDVQTASTRWASLNAAGVPSPDKDSMLPEYLSNFSTSSRRSISDDGRFVAFVSTARLNVKDSNDNQDIYVRDFEAGVSILASLNTAATNGQNGRLYKTSNGINFFSSDIALTGNGRKVFFTATGNNLNLGDQSGLDNEKVFQANVSFLAQRSNGEFDGDYKADFSIFRPSEGNWYSLGSSDDQMNIATIGDNGNRIVPADYDGDGRTDYAVYIASIGRWDILQSSNNSVVTRFYGTANDIPAPSDFDGDGRADLAYYRPSNGTWYILRSSTNAQRTQRFGLSGDIPAVGDYDGDNRADIAVFRPANGDWYVLRSSDSDYLQIHWGANGDKPTVGDFDGDSKSDFAVFRAGVWYVWQSRTKTPRIQSFGLAADTPAPADYDGDGQTDIAIWRGTSGDFWVYRSSDITAQFRHWGLKGDIPVAAAYIP